MSEKKAMVAEKGRVLVAIYDSLKRDFPSHWIIKQLDANYVTSGVMSARMFSLGSYPYCIEEKDASDVVQVDVFSVEEDDFEIIRAYYAHPFIEYLAEVQASIGGERYGISVSLFMLESCIGGTKIVPGVWTPQHATGVK